MSETPFLFFLFSFISRAPKSIFTSNVGLLPNTGEQCGPDRNIKFHASGHVYLFAKEVQLSENSIQVSFPSLLGRYLETMGILSLLRSLRQISSVNFRFLFKDAPVFSTIDIDRQGMPPFFFSPFSLHKHHVRAGGKGRLSFDWRISHLTSREEDRSESRVECSRPVTLGKTRGSG
jgi:hypothetical protein